MGYPALREQALKAIDLDPREAVEILAELQIKASEAAASLEDTAKVRLFEAHQRQKLIERIVVRVAAMHGLRSDVIRRPPAKLKNRHHVVMARSNAAWLMRAAGLKDSVIATALRTCHSQSKRYARRWDDHRSGLLKSVTEGQAYQVRSKMEGGASLLQACAAVGVGASRFEARIVAMRREGKL